MAPVDPREIQTLQAYLNEYKQQAELYTRQITLMEEGINEGRAGIVTLKELRNSENATIMMPVGGGLSLRVNVVDSDSVFVNIGADVVVEKSNDKAVAFLEGRITEMEASHKRISETLNNILAQAKDMSKRLEALYKQAQVEEQQKMSGRVPSN